MMFWERVVQGNLHVPFDLSEEETFTVHKTFICLRFGGIFLVGSQTTTHSTVSFKRFTYNKWSGTISVGTVTDAHASTYFGEHLFL